jgi:hypothetical protein
VVEAMIANSNIADLARDARALGAKCAVTADASRYEDLKELLAGSGVEAAAGHAAVLEQASRPADIVMAAIVGASGLAPTLAAVRTGTTVALANKECLVCAGALFMAEAQTAGAAIVPVDSEHNAIFQCLEMRNLEHVEQITLTASGGPFRTTALEQLRQAAPQDALRHPNWSMGPKVTIDSATLMNKGLGGDRGTSSVSGGARSAGRAGASAVDRPQPCVILRRLGAGANGYPGHVHPDCQRAGLAEADPDAGRAARSGAHRQSHLRGGRSRPIPGREPLSRRLEAKRQRHYYTKRCQ